MRIYPRVPEEARELPARLREVAEQVRRLSPCRRDPEAYHLAKDEIVKLLVEIAREADRRVA